MEIIRQQSWPLSGNMQHDGAGFEQDEITFLLDWNLAKRLARAMLCLRQFGKGNVAHSIS